jgi:K+-transporting ATPase KdpF subunit
VEFLSERFCSIVPDGWRLWRGLAAVATERWAFAGRRVMTGIELVGLGLSIALVVYLFLALLKPEWFG